MKTAKRCVPVILVLLFAFAPAANATHSEGADLTYKCLGGNQYQITLSFYRDCHGVAAPTAATVNFISVSTGQSFSRVLQPIPGTGQEIPVVYSSALTECQGGTYPGVQEWVYRDVVTLSPAVDWNFSFDLCCRNAAITTIVNPGNQNIHIESTLDNLNFPCNSSPTFSTKPVPFACINQSVTFNHGASDPDGDFITYELITPMNALNSTITYLNPYSATQPLTSVPAMAFDTVTGDINMTPTMLEVTVLAVKVKQWRNNQLVGYVIRDIQLRTLVCNNVYPYISGVNGSGTFTTYACTNSIVTFTINTYDPDTTQHITITWNHGIAGATFTSSGGQFPVGTFFWNPGPGDIGTHCFTITVTDDNCPINGSQTFSICLIVTGISGYVSTTSANCGANNGTAFVSVTGGVGPYDYLWLPCGCVTNPLNGLGVGSYTVFVTDANGCTTIGTGVVANGSAPGNINTSFTPPSCSGAANGTATANASGGQPPYSYSWSNGSSGQTITGLSTGTYVVTVTTAQGCAKNDTITITQPAPLTATVSSSDALCFGASNGSASVSASGGTAPYTYLWSNNSSGQNVSGLASGNYFVTVLDANACSDVQNVFIDQPATLALSVFAQGNVSCNGSANGWATIAAYGGVAPYTYQWYPNNVATASASGLSAGTYSVAVTDSNGCQKMIACTITQSSALSSTISSVPATCFGTATGATAVVISGGTGPYNYLWSPSGSQNANSTGLVAGNYSVMVTDANGCTLANNVVVSQPAQLVASVSNIQNASCNGLSNGSMQAGATGGTTPYSYQWNPVNVSGSAVSNLGAGIYFVNVTDANGCTVSVSASVTQPNALAVTAGASSTICPGQNATITATSSGGTTPYTYFWQPNVGFGNSQTVNPNATTTYTTIVTDANGCTSTAALTVSVHNNNFSIAAAATPGICAGQSATVAANSNGNNITGYSWANNLGSGPGPYTVSPTVTTIYTVTGYNQCGAISVATATVVVHPVPQVNIPPQAASDCGRAILHFADTNMANSGFSHVWTFGDGGTSYQMNPVHTYNQSGSYTVNVTVTSQYGCFASAQAVCNISVFPYPVAQFTSEPMFETSIIEPDFSFFDQSVNATNWEWDFGDGSVVSALKDPKHSYLQVGVYTVRLVTHSPGNCVDTAYRSVEVKPEFTFYIPNTFSPNGDHINDVFTGKGMEITAFEMTIFDRWGNKIFETNDIENGWDGRARGGSEIAQQDVYVYMVKVRDFEGTPHDYNGHVNLIK